MTVPLLTVDVGHRFTSDEIVIEQIALDVRRGEVVSIVGPSGCGKTTLVRIMSGLLTPSTGEVCHRGRTVDGVDPGTAVVFQDYRNSLYPWLRVVDNVAFPLRNQHRRAERRALADRALASVGLRGQSRKYPWELSGGMQQRVAIARALVMEPELLVMDEPFASVDAQTRAELEDLVLGVASERRDLSIVVVTHDIDESIYLADRVVVLAPAPTKVLGVVETELPRPRDQLATKAHPDFLRAREQIFTLLASRADQGDEA